MEHTQDQEGYFKTLSPEEKSSLNSRLQAARQLKELQDNPSFKGLLLDTFVEKGIAELQRVMLETKFAEPTEYASCEDQLRARLHLKKWMDKIITDGKHAATILNS